MSSLFLSILLVLSALLAPNAAAESQPVQSFFLMRPSGGDAADRNALETCAARFSSALTNAAGFRESQDAETQMKVSECLQESASANAQRACQLSMANVEVDFLIRLSSRRVGDDWVWLAEALSPMQGGAKVWSESLRQAAPSKEEAAWTSCQGLGRAFACAQGVAASCEPAPAPVVIGGVVGGLAVAPPRRAVTPTGPGYLSVFDVTPTPAKVALDGRELGSVPNEFRVEPGDYAVEVSAPGAFSWRGRVVVAPGETATLPAIVLRKQPATLTVTANISGALIRIDDKVVGQTQAGQPVEIPITPDGHTFTLEAAGYTLSTAQFAAQPGQRLRVGADLVSDEQIAETNGSRALHIVFGILMTVYGGIAVITTSVLTGVDVLSGSVGGPLIAGTALLTGAGIWTLAASPDEAASRLTPIESASRQAPAAPGLRLAVAPNAVGLRFDF
ncbi:MAG: PEGA domain-containing protein [Deltaproteobacteria bacterium]|nr:PEGA domain-containing protein [Deltaproteobacteria bacterium]